MKKKQMSDDDLKAIIKNYRTDADTMNNDLCGSQKENMDRYLAKPYGTERPNRSQITTSDIADTIESMIPSVIKVFSSSQNAVEFEPTDDGYEDEAKLRTAYVNYVFHKKNEGLKTLHNATKDALINSLGVIKVTWLEEENIKREEYKGLTLIQAATYIQNRKDIEVLNQDIYPNPDNPEEELFDIEFIITEDDSRVLVENVQLEEFYFSSKTKTMDDCKYCEHRSSKTISDLREMKINEDLIQVIKDKAKEKQDSDSDSNDESMLEIEIGECYLKVDYDGDGIAEMRKILVAGCGDDESMEILDNEYTDDNPFVCYTPILMPHQLVGRSITEMVCDLQELKTTLVRQVLDYIYQSNNPTTVINPDVLHDPNEVLNRNFGGYIRTKSDPRTALAPYQTPPLDPMVLTMIESVDSAREARTGVTRYNQGLDADSLNKTATGINAIMNAAQERLELIVRILAEEHKKLFRKIEKLASQHSNKSERIKLRGEWHDVDPRAWHHKMHTTINVGLGTGNKDQQVMHLRAIMEIMERIMQSGSTIVDEENLRYAFIKFIESSGFENTEMFVQEFEAAMQKKKEMQENQPPDIEMIKLEKEYKFKEKQLAFEREQAQAKIILEVKKINADIEIKARAQNAK